MLALVVQNGAVDSWTFPVTRLLLIHRSFSMSLLSCAGRHDRFGQRYSALGHLEGRCDDRHLLSPDGWSLPVGILSLRLVGVGSQLPEPRKRSEQIRRLHAVRRPAVRGRHDR